MEQDGWIADTDYGALGVERFLYVPGSPLPVATWVDGFPVDVAGVPTLAWEGWGSRGRPAGQGWTGDVLSGLDLAGAVELVREGVGRGVLGARATVHTLDLGGSDARIVFGRQDPDGEWAASAGIRKESQNLVSEDFRERGMSLALSHLEGWGRWRAAFLSHTSDLVLWDANFQPLVPARQELERLGLGWDAPGEVLGVRASFSRVVSGGHSEGRVAAAAAWTAPGVTRPGLLVSLAHWDSREHPRVQLAATLSDSSLELLTGWESGGAPRAWVARASGHLSVSPALELQLQGRIRRGLEGGSWSEARVQPGWRLLSGGLRLEGSVLLERDRALPIDRLEPAVRLLRGISAPDADAMGLQGQLEAPLGSNVTGRARWLWQRTRDLQGARLPFQAPVSGDAGLTWRTRVPFLPMRGHWTLRVHGVGDRTGEGARITAAHASLDAEAVVDYGALHFQAGWFNLSNLEYETTLLSPGSVSLPQPSPGRTIRFGITWDLEN